MCSQCKPDNSCLCALHVNYGANFALKINIVSGLQVHTVGYFYSLLRQAKSYGLGRDLHIRYAHTGICTYINIYIHTVHTLAQGISHK